MTPDRRAAGEMAPGTDLPGEPPLGAAGADRAPGSTGRSSVRGYLAEWYEQARARRQAEAPPAPRAPHGWAAPHLLGGRGRAEIVIAGVLILAGALTDTLAFKSTLNLLLRQSQQLSWIMAIGATSMALVAAASLGISLAYRRRGEPGSSRRMVAATAIAWAGLGMAMFLVRWFDSNGTTPAFGSSGFGSGTTHPALTALFFAAIYAISGACTIIEAERLYNPEYFAYRRLGRQFRKQAAVAARAEGELSRARLTVDHHCGEFDRENHRRTVAITERQALGAEAANYARYLMAGMLQDPVKTGITETGPTPHLPGPVGLQRARPGRNEHGSAA